MIGRRVEVANKTVTPCVLTKLPPLTNRLIAHKGTAWGSTTCIISVYDDAFSQRDLRLLLHGEFQHGDFSSVAQHQNITYI